MIKTAPRQTAAQVILLAADDLMAQGRSEFTEWDLTMASSTSATPGALTGTLSQRLQLTDGIGEAYTPTSVGKDGTVFAVDNARVYAIRAAPQRRVITPTVSNVSSTKDAKPKR